jgi:hypothetical protein
LDARMDRLPDAEVHTHHPLCLGRIGRARNGDVQTVAAAVRGDESSVSQEILQVTEEAGSVDGDVQALRRSGVAAKETPSLTVVRKPSASRVNRAHRVLDRPR